MLGGSLACPLNSSMLALFLFTLWGVTLNVIGVTSGLTPRPHIRSGVLLVNCQASSSIFGPQNCLAIGTAWALFCSILELTARLKQF